MGWILFISFGLIIWFIYACVKEYRDDTKAIRDREESDKLWIKNQENKKAKIKFYLVNNNVVFYTGKYAADVCSGFYKSYHYTATEQASKALRQAYEAGYITCDKGVTYPTCNLLSAEVVEG